MPWNCVKQNVNSVLETDWLYLPIVFGMVVLLHNMSKAFIVVKVLLR